MHKHCVNQFDLCIKKPINSVLNRYFFCFLFPSHSINNTILFETDHVFPLSCINQRWKHCLRHFYLCIILVSLTGKYHQHGIMEPQSISATLNRQTMYRKLDRILMILSGL